MTVYQAVVVGTDGSESSLRAVDRAAEIAAESNAKLFIATGFLPQRENMRAADILKDEGWRVHGNAPRIYAILRAAHARARAAGAKNIAERPIGMLPGTCAGRPRRGRWRGEQLAPICWWSAMWDWTRDPPSSGRNLSIPGSVATRAKIDVLIVHTTD